MNDIQLSASMVIYRHSADEIQAPIENFLSTRLRVQLYLVANAPAPHLARFAAHPQVRIIHSYHNPGFGKGHNLAIRQAAGSQYHLILNPDIGFCPGVLETLYEYMESHSDVGNIMPKVLYPDGRLQRLCKLLPTPLNVWSRRFLPWPRWAKKLNHDYELRDFDYEQIMQIPNLSGCFMFIRNSILRLTGGFDERFFLYLEDIDLNRRIAQHAKTVFYPYVSITHRHSRGSYNHRDMLKHHIISAIKYFNKWGWFFDKERTAANNLARRQIRQATQKP